MPGKDKLPSTLKRSPKKAQNTYEKTLESAEGEYGEGERASRTAYASLKHSFEKVGDHWEPKEHKGPSDDSENYGGVDVNGHTKEELMALARKMSADVTTNMKKSEIAKEIDKKNKQATAKSRA